MRPVVGRAGLALCGRGPKRPAARERVRGVDVVNVAVLGAGGHGKVVVATLEDAGHRVSGVFDDAASSVDRHILGHPIAGPLSSSPADSATVVAIGENRPRAAVVAALQRRWFSVVHPTAYVHPSARLGAGTVVFAHAVVQPGVVVGDHVIVNTRASVDHDCVVDNFAHLAPGVSVAGSAHIGEGALIGVGAAVAPGVRIGPWSILGAGAVAIRDLPAGSVAIGVPARPRSIGVQP